MLPNTVKAGDKVRSKTSGEVGTILFIPRERELRDCVVVTFRPQSDGLTLLRSSLELVTGHPEGDASKHI